MSLTLFVTLCVLGCDLLIYLLYQWALGERRRTLMRKAVSRQRAEALANRQPRPMVACRCFFRAIEVPRLTAERPQKAGQIRDLSFPAALLPYLFFVLLK